MYGIMDKEEKGGRCEEELEVMDDNLECRWCGVRVERLDLHTCPKHPDYEWINNKKEK